MTVNEGRENAQTIKAKSINPISLIFAMKSKYRETYGDKSENTNHSTIDLKGSNISYVIGDDGLPIADSIGIDPDSAASGEQHGIDPDADDYNAAMREINR